MKKIILLLLVCFLAMGCAFKRQPKLNLVSEGIDVLPVMSSESNYENRLWVGTFQLVWNDLMDELIKGPVEFYAGTPQIVHDLNKQDFKVDYLSDASYYKKFGKVSVDLKNEIESALKEKFNEKSDILNNFNWTPEKGKYLFYAMLKKDFKFLKAFDKLEMENFGASGEKVQYFGINSKTDEEVHENVRVLFYNSDSDFAVKLLTQQDDYVYLYRTDDNKNFEQFYNDMNEKSKVYDGAKYFAERDRLKVPDIKLYQNKSFKEVCNKQIKNTDLEISDAIETVDFKMNNEGVKLKSEAAIMTKCTAMPPEFQKPPRYFYFNDKFVLFLQEKGKSKPYFALRVSDVALINKTGKD